MSERVLRMRAPRVGRRLVLMVESEEGKRMRSGLYVPSAGGSTEKRCERCETRATVLLKGQIAMALHGNLFRDMGDGPKMRDRLKAEVDREFASVRGKHKVFLEQYAQEGCGVCGGEGYYSDMPDEIPGTLRAWVLSASEDCSLLGVGDFIVIPKHTVRNVEYIRSPERHLGVSSRGLWVADDEDRIFEWGAGKWLIVTTEDAYPWVYAGELGSALSPTTGGGADGEEGTEYMTPLAAAACSTS